MTHTPKAKPGFITSLRKFILLLAGYNGLTGYNDLNSNDNYLPDKTLHKFLIAMIIIIAIEIIVTAAILLKYTNG